MKELFEVSFSVVNIIPTFLLVFVLLYWLVVFMGFVDPSADLHAEKDMDLSSNSAAGGLNSVLAFFNLGQVPLMLFISLLALPMWFISVMFNYYTGNTFLSVSLIALLPNLLVSLFIAKFLTAPFVKIFSTFEGDTEKKGKVIGKVCTVLLPVSHDKIGQGMIKDKDNTLMLNISTQEGTSLEKGKSALVIQYLKNKKTYLVEPYEA